MPGPSFRMRLGRRVRRGRGRGHRRARLATRAVVPVLADAVLAIEVVPAPDGAFRTERPSRVAEIRSLNRRSSAPCRRPELDGGTDPGPLTRPPFAASSRRTRGPGGATLGALRGQLGLGQGRALTHRKCNPRFGEQSRAVSEAPDLSQGHTRRPPSRISNAQATAKSPPTATFSGLTFDSMIRGSHTTTHRLRMRHGIQPLTRVQGPFVVNSAS